MPATPPSIAIAAPVLGGPEVVRVVFHRQSFHFDTEDTGPAYTQMNFNTARGPPPGPLSQQQPAAVQHSRGLA